jgi:hypothetical protein
MEYRLLAPIGSAPLLRSLTVTGALLLSLTGFVTSAGTVLGDNTGFVAIRVTGFTERGEFTTSADIVVGDENADLFTNVGAALTENPGSETTMAGDAVPE